MIRNFFARVARSKNCLILLLLSLPFLASANSRLTMGPEAQDEFLLLEEKGDLNDYLARGHYAELEGTPYVALLLVSDSRRSCIFGFERAPEDGAGLFETESLYVCFDSGSYILKESREWCERGSPGCADDGISIGIGNLKLINPLQFPKDKILLPRPLPRTLKFESHRG